MLQKLPRTILLTNLVKRTVTCSFSPKLNLSTVPLNVLPNALKIHKQFSLLTPIISQTGQKRYKFDKRRINITRDDDEDESSDVSDFGHLQDGKDSKISKIKVTSLRADMIIKTGLGMARNKVEATFYDSKIRINGKKISKKSVSVKTGDEIDVIKEFSPLNTENLVVARIEVLSVHPNADDITVILRRFKMLTIENYPSENAWRHHAPSG